MKNWWSKHPRIAGLLITALILGFVVLYALEFHYFNRTLGFGRLLWWSLPVGAAVGAGLGYRFRKQGSSRLERVQLYVFFIVLCTLFAPLFASLSNRLLAPQAARSVPVEFAGVEPRFSSRFGLMEDEKPVANQFYLFFYYDGRLHRIRTDSLRFPEAVRGDTVQLMLKRGLWGKEIVQ